MNFRRDATLLENAHSVTASNSGEGAIFGPGHLANALWVGAAGNVALVLGNDDVVTLIGVLAGTWHAMPPFKRINSTGTTATGLVAGITFRT